LADRVRAIAEQQPFSAEHGGLASTDAGSFAQSRATLVLLAVQAYPILVRRFPTLRVESLRESHPKDGVSDVAIIGVPHPDFGEAVVAVVTADRADLDPAQIEAVATEKLARFKQPKAIRIVDEFPRNAMGKVLKAELRKRFAGLFIA
jgi:hypothetical protein